MFGLKPTWELGALGAVLAACGAPPSETVSSSAQPLVQGTDDDADPEVVALFAGATPYCTGTLIAPRVVLTAAHCVRDGAPSAVSFDALATRDVVAVTQAITHPSFDPSTFENDLAALVLATGTQVEPAVPLETSLDADMIGRDVRVVGFGITQSSAPAWRRRTGSARVAAIDASTIELKPDPSLPCLGDSGGPAFVATSRGERLAGVTSHGDPDCQSVAVDVRVDVNVHAFIDPIVQSVTPSAPQSDGSGGGCAVTGMRPPGVGWAGIPFIALLLRRRERRSE